MMGMDLSRVADHDPTVVTGEDREAGVLAPILTRDGAEHVLFTKRAEDLADHPGQMSFPGGGHEAVDADLLATALREADEEVKLAPGEVDVVGRLDDIHTVTGYQVRPFVGLVPDRAYSPGDREVAEVAVLPVADFLDRDNYESERRDHPEYGEIRLHYFHVDGYTVWGATARMLVQLLALATEWDVPTSEHAVDHDADLPN
jgi:8-oxo-dGTP pyrophosphatase MutT (NUDIX family)